MTLRCLLCRVKFGPNDLSDYAANQALQAIIDAKHLALRPGLLENRFVQLPSGKQSRTNEAVPVSNVVPVERMVGDDDEDTTLLRQMWTVAERYVLSFSWCESIVSAYFGGGVAKILAFPGQHFPSASRCERMGLDYCGGYSHQRICPWKIASQRWRPFRSTSTV